MSMSEAVHTQVPLRHPDNLKRMALAVDRAWAALARGGASEGTRRELARLAIAHFDRGERDPERLTGLILSELVLERANALCA